MGSVTPLLPFDAVYVGKPANIIICKKIYKLVYKI